MSCSSRAPRQPTAHAHSRTRRSGPAHAPSSLGRTHINSCDFSVRSYSFDDTEDDFSLDDFDTNVTHDVDSGMVGMMREAADIVARSYPAETASQYGLRIIASPWSPPAWMKAPTEDDAPEARHAENMTGSAEPVCLRDGVDKESAYAQSWALFFSKFIAACECACRVLLRDFLFFPACWFQSVPALQLIAKLLSAQMPDTASICTASRCRTSPSFPLPGTPAPTTLLPRGTSSPITSAPSSRNPIPTPSCSCLITIRTTLSTGPNPSSMPSILRRSTLTAPRSTGTPAGWIASWTARWAPPICIACCRP